MAIGPAGLCDCPRTHRCDACCSREWSQLGGVAMARGVWWAERVARTRPLSRPWWSYEASAAIARAAVAELAADPRILERFARACWEDAARRWGQLRAASLSP